MARDNYNYTNLLKNEEEINKFNNLLIANEKLKKYCQIHNPESLNEFYKDFQIYHNQEYYLHNSLVYILSNKVIIHNLTCGDLKINQYIDSEKELMKYLNYSQIAKDTKEGISGHLYRWNLNNELKNNLKIQCEM